MSPTRACPACRHTECACDCATCEARRQELEARERRGEPIRPCPCYSCARLRLGDRTRPDAYWDTGHRWSDHLFHARHCLDCGLLWTDVRPARLAPVCPGTGHADNCRQCRVPTRDELRRS